LVCFVPLSVIFVRFRAPFHNAVAVLCGASDLCLSTNLAPAGRTRNVISCVWNASPQAHITRCFAFRASTFSGNFQKAVSDMQFDCAWMRSVNMSARNSAHITVIRVDDSRD
jgi:hypothetical protein